MKILVAGNTFRRQSAVTLVEMMMAMLTTTIAVAAILSAYMYGMRTTEFIKPKLLAADDARRIVSLMTDELRSAKTIYIGNGNAISFTKAPYGVLQRGNALLVYPSTNTNAFICYYLDTAEKRLKRATNGATSSRLIADSVTNQIPFTFEDIAGETLTNSSGTLIIGMNLRFFQQGFRANTNSVGYYDSYQLSTKITKRTS